MAGVVHLPWYATGFRADKLEAALNEVAPTALRYGATSYAVHRFHDDRYKFLHISTFPNKTQFERWWAGPEMTQWRVLRNGWYQVPMQYAWADVTAEGALPQDPMVSASRSQVVAEGTGDAV